MSWAEVKKINSNLNIAIDELIVEQLLNTGAEVFTGNGTYTVPNGVRKIFVTMVDGGGGGGASRYDNTWGSQNSNGGKGGGANGGNGGTARNTSFSRVYSGGGGGGGGGCIVNEPLLVVPGDVYDIVVGAGGVGSSDYGTVGGNGSDSKITKNNVDVLVTNLPGGAGASDNSGRIISAGAGGAYGAGGGGIGCDDSGSGSNLGGNLGGKGGHIGGTGGTGGGTDKSGTNGGVYGAGGGGGGSASSYKICRGGNGAPGIVIICYSPYTFLNLASSLKGV